MNFIQNLQNKSERRKKVILFASVAVLMMLVLAVWIFQMKHNLAQTQQTRAESQSRLAPISEIKENMVNIYNESAAKAQEIKEAFDMR